MGYAEHFSFKRLAVGAAVLLLLVGLVASLITHNVSATNCVANNDIGGKLFLDTDGNGVADGALYTGTNGTLATNVGGNSSQTTGDGIDGYAYPPLQSGGNKANTPQAFWGPRTSQLGQGDPNQASKGQPTSDITVHVKIYDSSNTQIVDTTLDSSGSWKLSNATSILPVRVEYTNLPSGYSFTSSTDQSTGPRQFITQTGCSYDAGYYRPADFCQDNPTIAVNCDLAPSATGNTVLSLPYNASEKLSDSNNDGTVDQNDAGSSSPVLTKNPATTASLATNAQTGPLFGMAYQKLSKYLVVSAATVGSGGYSTGQTRSVSGYGPNGPGGLYTINTAASTPSATSLYTVTGVGTGSTYPTSIGNSSFGGTAISDDGTALYTADLTNKKLINLTLTAAANTAPTVTARNDISIPDPGCTANGSDTYRPFGVTWWHNAVYVGTVCTNQQKGFIQKYAGSTWTTVYSTNISEVARIGGDSADGGLYTDLTYYQPFMITGFSFDTDGSLIIGTSAGPGNTDNSQGDVYLVPYSNGSYGAAQAVLPGSQNFQDNTGAIATLPGSGEVIAGAADPTVTLSNGLVWYNTSTGTADKKYSLYRTTTSPYDGTLAESNAIGGIALLCQSAPVRLGGRVWYDSRTNNVNNNREDPGESIVADVTVNLYNSSNNLIGTTTTSSQGVYSFGGIANTNLSSGQVLQPGTSYSIRFDNPADYTAGHPLEGRSLATLNASGTDQYNSSKAILGDSDYAEIDYTTGSAGDVPANLDAGFVQPADPTPPADSTPPTVSVTAPSNGSTVSGSSVTLSANASDNVSVASVNFTVDGSSVHTSTSSPYTYTWDSTSVSNGTHTIQAIATDPSGNTDESSVNITVNNAPPPDTTAPGIPNSVNASVASSSQINVSWSASTDTGGSGLAGYNIYRNGSGTPLNGSVITSTSYGDTGLTASTQYTYRVTAVDNAANESDKSSSSSATTQAPPDTINPSATISTPHDSDTVSGNVSVSGTADGTGTNVASVGVSLDGGLQTSASGVTNAPTTNWSYSFDSTTLTNGLHSITVNVSDAAGNPGSASININVNNVNATPIAGTPTTPTGLTTLGPVNPTEIGLTWNASTETNGAVTGYYIIRTTSNPNTSVTFSTADSDSMSTGTSYIDDTVAPNTAYTYQVVAFDANNGSSNPSNSLRVSTPAIADTTPPDAPTNLKAAAINAVQINITWTASTDNGGSGVKGYNIFRAGATTPLNSSLITTTGFGDTGLSASTKYSYFIVAVDNANNISSQSAVVSATTNNTPPDILVSTPNSPTPNSLIPIPDTTSPGTTLNASGSDLSSPAVKSSSTGIAAIIDQLQNAVGNVKSFIQANITPTVARSLPYYLFALFAAAILLLIFESYQELRFAKRAKHLIDSWEVISQEKNSFIKIAAHYLRTPFALIKGSIELQLPGQSAKVTKEFKELFASVGETIDGAVAFAEQAQQAPNPASAIKVDREVNPFTKPLFWAPLGIVAALGILADILFGSIGGLSLGVTNLISQILVFAILAGIGYVFFRRFYVTYQENKQLNAILKEQKQLDANRGRFIELASDKLSESAQQLNLKLSDINAQLSKSGALRGGFEQFNKVIATFGLVIHLQQNRVEHNDETFNVKDLLDKAFHDQAGVTTQKQLVIKREDKTPINITQSKQLLSIVLESVVKNAVEFAPEKGSVGIKVTHRKGKINITVTDDGPIISAKYREELFKPFARLENAETFDHAGLGMSLYLSKLIMYSIGGDIAFDGVKDGASITISVPTEPTSKPTLNVSRRVVS